MPIVKSPKLMKLNKIPVQSIFNPLTWQHHSASLPRYIAKWPGCNDNVTRRWSCQMLEQGANVSCFCCRKALQSAILIAAITLQWLGRGRSWKRFERNPTRRRTLLIHQNLSLFLSLLWALKEIHDADRPCWSGKNHHLLIREASTNCSPALLQRKRWKKLRGTN